MQQFHAEDAPFWLDESPIAFPPAAFALREPDGLLAIGGGLSPQWILAAYRQGIFPWFNPEDPILWWSPNPRSVLPIKQLKIRRSLRQRWKEKVLSGTWQITLDTNFSHVMAHCANIPRNGQNGTWINQDMLYSYSDLHRQGYAHSVEVWQGDSLIGGLYGIAIGKMFFGESMFAKSPDASKIALTALCLQLNKWGFTWIDTQVETPHLNSLGARLLSRDEFEEKLQQFTQKTFKPQRWQFDLDWQQALHDYLQQQKTNDKKTLI
ncbi:leucyl/phenylalanyl-tRNA--protein transferase [Thiosulfatimonas sediminis]|uniref:Leucyl/phenylalanyl-tRNA--protein transferase n=1 Tax=Thiosulfatimonas sediminis TaxID=2675054 RepID=A0A6F8PVH0_9GAMM|nr:leucyl/phenylalanyl-tRNA--protein transferase [Thiosulfatimonas sediminis]BBP46037.1 leucyl/phenylalanyl-tRNA--protein transferase [Thiosulfatimonas sediminis]